MSEVLTKLTETMDVSLERFQTVSINLDRKADKKEIDPKVYAEVRMLLNTATMSAISVKRLVGEHELDIEEEEAIVEQVSIIQQTMDYCREENLLC